MERSRAVNQPDYRIGDGPRLALRSDLLARWTHYV